MNLVNIAFQGGTHGNFLMFFIDKFSRNTKDIEGTPFTENHTSHVQLDFSGNVRHYHPSDEKPFFENINEPHILITIDKEDLKYIERWATIRAGDQKVDTSHDHTVVNSSFLEQFKWKEPFMQLYNIDLSSKQNIPKFLMRDYYKMMFLDPDKIKDYLYVDDFCDAVSIGCEKGLFGKDFNIAAETPYKVSDIMRMLETELKVDFSSVVKWHADTDYLGNHRLSTRKFRSETGWSPKYNLHDGISKAVEDIRTDFSQYDPLAHIDEARNLGVDLTQFFPKQ